MTTNIIMVQNSSITPWKFICSVSLSSPPSPTPNLWCRIRQYIWEWLLLLHIMPLRLTQIVVCISSLSIFITEWYPKVWIYHWVFVVVVSLIDFFFFFQLLPWHMEVPGPGVTSESHLRPIPQLRQCWILNSLPQTRDLAWPQQRSEPLQRLDWILNLPWCTGNSCFWFFIQSPSK